MKVWLKGLLRWMLHFIKWAGMGLAVLLVFSGSVWVTMKVVMGRQEVEVPDLIGMKPPQAEKSLGKLDLKLKVEAYSQFSDTIEKGTVASQYPIVGNRLKRENIVRVVLSRGSQRLMIPSLLGGSVRRAQLEIRSMGLKIGRVYSVYSEEPMNSIIAQDPLPSMEEMPGAAVNVLVSLGPRATEYIMPDLVGKSLEQVREALETKGFRIGNIRSKYYPWAEEGVIIQQTPQAGFKVKSDAIINLWVSEGME
ncbi:MAG: PASTA domain-containing protein [Acidobacteriota bacterium]